VHAGDWTLETAEWVGDLTLTDSLTEMAGSLEMAGAATVRGGHLSAGEVTFSSGAKLYNGVVANIDFLTGAADKTIFDGVRKILPLHQKAGIFTP
jgi:hypothetical protein